MHNTSNLGANALQQQKSTPDTTPEATIHTGSTKTGQ